MKQVSAIRHFCRHSESEYMRMRVACGDRVMYDGFKSGQAINVIESLDECSVVVTYNGQTRGMVWFMPKDETQFQLHDMTKTPFCMDWYDKYKGTIKNDAG